MKLGQDFKQQIYPTWDGNKALAEKDERSLNSEPILFAKYVYTLQAIFFLCNSWCVGLLHVLAGKRIIWLCCIFAT